MCNAAVFGLHSWANNIACEALNNAGNPINFFLGFSLSFGLLLLVFFNLGIDFFLALLHYCIDFLQLFKEGCPGCIIFTRRVQCADSVDYLGNLLIQFSESSFFLFPALIECSVLICEALVPCLKFRNGISNFRYLFEVLLFAAQGNFVVVIGLSHRGSVTRRLDTAPRGVHGSAQRGREDFAMTDTPPNPEAQTLEDRYAELYEEQVMNAILNGGKIKIQTTLPMGKNTMPIELNMRWPTVGDHQEIGRLTTLMLGGVEPRLAVPRDLTLARARAYIEVLGEAPFPAWLPPHREPVETIGTGGQPRTSFRPNTADCRMPQALIELYYEADEVIQRFQYMGC